MSVVRLRNADGNNVFKLMVQVWTAGGTEVHVPADRFDLARVGTDLSKGCAKKGRTGTYRLLRAVVAQYRLPFFFIDSNKEVSWRHLVDFKNHFDFAAAIDNYVRADYALAKIRDDRWRELDEPSGADISTRYYTKRLATNEFGSIAKLKEMVTSNYTKERWYRDRVANIIGDLSRADTFILTGDSWHER